MTHLVAKFRGMLGRKDNFSDPVYTFFFETKARERKRVYSSALRKAQLDQEKTLEMAKEKARA
jgi:hypothetical protein